MPRWWCLTPHILRRAPCGPCSPLVLRVRPPCFCVGPWSGCGCACPRPGPCCWVLAVRFVRPRPPVPAGPGFPVCGPPWFCPVPGSGAGGPFPARPARPCRGVPQGSAAAPLAGWRCEFLCHSAQLAFPASPAISAVSWALRRSRRTGLRSKPKSAPSQIRTVHPAAFDPVMIHAAGTARARHAMRRIPA